MPDNEIQRFEGVTEPLKRRFLIAFAQTGRVTSAAREAEIERTSHYRWMHEDEAYRAAFEDCRRWVCLRIEEGLVERLIDGWEEPVYHNGEQIGTKRKYDNAACLRYLERVNPKVFGGNEPVEGVEKVSTEVLLAAMAAANAGEA